MRCIIKSSFSTSEVISGVVNTWRIGSLVLFPLLVSLGLHSNWISLMCCVIKSKFGSSEVISGVVNMMRDWFVLVVFTLGFLQGFCLGLFVAWDVLLRVVSVSLGPLIRPHINYTRDNF